MCLFEFFYINVFLGGAQSKTGGESRILNQPQIFVWQYGWVSRGFPVSLFFLFFFFIQLFCGLMLIYRTPPCPLVMVAAAGSRLRSGGT